MSHQPDDQSEWVLFAGMIAILLFSALLGLFMGFAALRWSA